MNKERLTDEAIEKRLRGVNLGGVYVRWLEWGGQGAGPIGQLIQEKDFRWVVIFSNQVMRYLPASDLAWAEKPLGDQDLLDEMTKERPRKVEVIVGANEGVVAPICRYMSDTGKWMVGENSWYGQFPAHHLQFVEGPTSEIDVQCSCGTVLHLRYPAGQIEVSTSPVLPRPRQADAPDSIHVFREHWKEYKQWVSRFELMPEEIPSSEESLKTVRQWALRELSDEVMDFLLSRLK